MVQADIYVRFTVVILLLVLVIGSSVT